MRSHSLWPLCAVLLLGACGSKPAAVNTGLDSLAEGDPPARSAAANASASVKPVDPGQQAALDLQQVLDQMESRERNRAGAPSSPPPSPPPIPSVSLAEAAGRDSPPAPPEAKAEPEPEMVVQAAPKPLDQRISDAAVVLVDLLRQQSLESPEPARAYVALAALEALRPGSLPDVHTPDGKNVNKVAPSEWRAAEALRDLVIGMTTGSAAGNESELADLLDDLALRLGALQQIRIRTARLCSRVEGFGQYTPFSGNRFLQGRTNRVIVYAEVDRFAHRPSQAADTAAGGTGGEWTVDLSQELNLYHDADTILAWRRPEERVVETSHNKRRDFYVIQMIDLPPTLTVGAYNLKVIMRDKTSGAAAEALIPIQIVADAALAQRPN